MVRPRILPQVAGGPRAGGRRGLAARRGRRWRGRTLARRARGRSSTPRSPCSRGGGLHQTRIEDIAAEAGLSKGLVYRYFADKDALVVALVDDFYGAALAHLRAAEGGDGPIADHLARFTDHLGATMERMAPLLPVTFEFYVSALRRVDMGRILARYYADYRAVTRALIRRGIDRGELRARSVDEAADALIALYEGTTVLWAVDQGGASWTERARAAVALALDGLRVKGNPPR